MIKEISQGNDARQTDEKGARHGPGDARAASRECASLGREGNAA